MANKYQTRRRELRDTSGRGENLGASVRGGKRGEKALTTGYTPPPPMDRVGLTASICLGLVVLVTILYVQTARHDFTVCDDNVYIYDKPQIVSGLTWENVKWAFGDAHEGNWHPLTWISHMLDWQLFSEGSWQPENLKYGYSWPGGHHLVGMGIHCINVVLLFLALRLMTGTLWPSLFVAVLFAAHPLRAESVAWAAERKDVLCGLFWMSSLVSYALYARRPRRHATSLGAGAASALAIHPGRSHRHDLALFAGQCVHGHECSSRRLFFRVPWSAQFVQIGGYSLVTLFFGLGLTAKSMIVTLPCVLLLLDVWPLNRWLVSLPPRELRCGRRHLLDGLL